MAYDFDGTGDFIAATITAVDSTDWTMAAWVNIDTFTSGDRIFEIRTSGGTFVQSLNLSGTGGAIQAIQAYTGGTGNHTTTTTTTLPASTWKCVIATFRASDKKCRIFIGDQSNAMTEASYSAQTFGGTTRVTGGTALRLGANSSGTQDYDGRIERATFVAAEWDATKMATYRTTGAPADFTSSRGYWPLTSNANDTSGQNANGQVTNATLVAGPSFGSNTDLVIADATHGHTADAVTFTQAHTIAVANAAHAHTADNVTVTQVHTLTVNNTAHAVTSDQVALEQTSTSSTLTINDAAHAHTAGTVALTQTHTLAVADSAHVHKADTVTLTFPNLPGTLELSLAASTVTTTHTAPTLETRLAAASIELATTAAEVVLT